MEPVVDHTFDLRGKLNANALYGYNDQWELTTRLDWGGCRPYEVEFEITVRADLVWSRPMMGYIRFLLTDPRDESPITVTGLVANVSTLITGWSHERLCIRLVNVTVGHE